MGAGASKGQENSSAYFFAACLHYFLRVLFCPRSRLRLQTRINTISNSTTKAMIRTTIRTMIRTTIRTMIRVTQVQTHIEASNTNAAAYCFCVHVFSLFKQATTTTDAIVVVRARHTVDRAAPPGRSRIISTMTALCLMMNPPPTASHAPLTATMTSMHCHLQASIQQVALLCRVCSVVPVTGALTLSIYLHVCDSVPLQSRTTVANMKRQQRRYRRACADIWIVSA